MPVLHPISPADLRRVLEAAGYELIASTRRFWYFARGSSGFPIVVPRTPRVISVRVLLRILKRSGIEPVECSKLLQAVALLSVYELDDPPAS